MAFDPDVYLAEGGGVKETPFDPDAYLGIEKPVGTSIGDTLQTAAEELEAGVGRAGSAFAKSAVGSVRMFTDLFGANNKVSKEIAGVEDYIDQFTTAQAKQDKEEISRLFQEAEGKGLGNKVMAGLKAVAVSPETLGPEMAGYMLPSLAAGLLTGGASIPVQIGAQATIGAAQAAGSIKGDIYQSVRDYSREQGLSEVEADRAATEAQSYGGKNLDLILTNAGIGALAASTGAERIATRILTGRGKDVTKKTLGEFLKQGAMAGGVEALTEGTQEAAEQISQNIALQREGKDVPTFQNVPQVATMGAVAGGVIGGGLKGVEFLSAEEKAEQDINRSADREARSLSATDSTTKKVINDLNQSENAIDSLRQELDTLEPTDPKAQQLRMRISEEQKKAVGLKQSIGEEFLSEPITEIEEQQAALAVEIAAPTEPTIKQSLTVQPTQAAPAKPIVTEEPPVSMVGKEVIPGVTPIPVAPAKPKVPAKKAAPVTEQAAPAQNIITVFHATDTQPKAGQRSGYYPGTYTATDEELAKSFGKNLFSTQVDKNKIYKISNESDAQQLKKDARNAGLDVREANGKGETEYLVSKGYEAIQRGKEIILLSPEKYEFNQIKQQEAALVEQVVTPPAEVAPAITEAEPITEESFGKLPTAEAETTLSENVAEREKPSIKPLKQPSIKQLIARREPIPAKKAYGYKLPSEYKLNYDTEMWEVTPATEQAAPAEAPAPEVAPVVAIDTSADTYTSGMSSMDKGRITKVLNKPVRFNNLTLPVVEHIQRNIDNGATIVSRSVRQVLTPKRKAELQKESDDLFKKVAGAKRDESNPEWVRYMEVRKSISDNAENVIEENLTMPNGDIMRLGVTEMRFAKWATKQKSKPTPAISETITEPTLAPKKRKGILGEQYIKKDWTNLTSEELPVLDSELGNYYGWAKGIVDKLIPNSNEFEKKALIMELRNEVTQETAKPEFKDRQQSNIAYNVAAQLLTGKRKKVLQRAKQRAMDDEYAAWEMGGRFDETPISVEAFDANSKGKPLPEGYVKQGDLYVYQPAISETIEKPKKRTLKPRFDSEYVKSVRPIVAAMLTNTRGSEVITKAAGKKLSKEQEIDVAIEWAQILKEQGEVSLPSDFGMLSMEQAYMVEPALENLGLLKPTPTPAVSETITEDTRKTKVSDTQYQTEGVIPATESTTEESQEEVEEINNLPDNSTYEEVEKTAPKTITALKAAAQNVSGSYSEFAKILSNSFKSLVRFAETIWKKIKNITQAIAITSGIGAGVFTPYAIVDYNRVAGEPGRQDSRATGLVRSQDNLFKKYIKNLSVDQIEKSLVTPDKTLLLIEDAAANAKPYQGSIEINADDINRIASTMNLNSFKEGSDKRSFNYNALIDVTDSEIKSAAEFIRSSANRVSEIEAILRDIAGGLEYISKRKLKNIKIEIKNTSAQEAAAFIALSRKGGGISSLSTYDPETDTINLQPQTLLALLDNSVATLNAVGTIANELTHALQFQTNNGNLIGLLDIQLSDFDTARNVLWMGQGAYKWKGAKSRSLNMESNWGEDLSMDLFSAKNKIERIPFSSFVEQNPNVKQSLQEKETQDFIASVVEYRGAMQARAGGVLIPTKEDTRKTKVSDTQYQTEGVIPEAERFTEDELRVIVNDIFGGKIPDKIEIITDAKDPNKEFKAAYSIRRGTITYNLAYIAKEDDIGFVTNHELGHFIMGDPKFQVEMARLFDSLPPDIQEKLKVAIDEAYAQESIGVRAEELIVFAFGEILENAPDARNILQRFLDAIRDAINRLFKTEGYIPRNPKKAAAAILMAARNRFERGEFIKRPNGSVVNIAPDIRRMAVKKGQVASIKNAGAEKKTPKQIIARTRELLRKDFFNPAEVTEQNTLTAFRALGKLVGPKKQAAAYAEELNDIGRLVDEEGVASEVSMGAILFTNDLFEYSIKLAAEGQKMMLGIMMSNMNKLPLGEGLSLEESARSMRGALERSTRFTMMGKAEQDAFANYVAEFIYGPNPSKEQIQSIKDAYAKVEKTEPITEGEITDELDKVGEKTGTDLVNKITIQIEEATPPTRDPIVAAMLALQKLGGGTIETKYLPYSKRASSRFEGVKKILKGGLSNYRQKMVEGAATGLETGFWKTLSNEENKPGSLGELDAAQNRELGNIVKSMLISLGLKGTPPNTKMSIYEQVASILGEKPLSNDKIKLADENIRAEIKRKREKELDATEDSDEQDAINVKYDGIESAWDKAMAQQLDMPISESTMRRLIFNELKEEKTSIAKLAKLMNDEPVIASSRQDRLVNSIIEKIAGVTFEGQNPADYSILKEYLSNQLDGLIQERQIKEAAAKAKAQLAKEAKGSVELQAEKAENEAQRQIEKLAKIQSDTPSFEVKLPSEAKMNPVREAVKNALKLNLNKMFDPKQSGEIISNFKKSFVKELKGLGVEETAAGILADVVGRQIEINSLNNQLKSIDRAIEKGPISEIIKAIKDTPLEEQQKPNWRYEVMRDYLRKAGLPLAQAERIAKLMDISLQKRFTMAQEEAFTQAISKSAPWKNGDTRSRRAFQKVLQALRAGALDPTRNVLSDMAALNGWTGFTPEQYKDLLKYDAILADPKTTKADLAEAHKAIQNIISKAKLPIRARDVIGQYYDAQALSGITTMTVNIFSPAGMAARNALVQSLNGLVTARPEQITAAMTTFVDSIKSWANTVAYSFKNNVTVYSNVEYLVNDEGLLKLYNRGVDQFNNGKTPRDRADGVKNMMVGMMDYVRRILNALDYGAIASLQNQAVSKYALAVMQAKGMSSADGTKMLNAMMEQKRIFYTKQIAIGTDKNKAAVLADEFFISAWEDALTKEGVEKSEIKKAMDAALNDAMSSVGRNRQSLDAFMEEETNIRDEGLLSFPAIWLLETIANGANKQDSQFIKIFSRIIYGFAIVPARVLREAAWFSPLAAHRFAYEYIAKKKGLKSRYAQSLGNDLQYRQRLTETITGSIVMLAFGAAMSASTDDEEDKKPFKIVVTGNGPLRNEDPQFHDSWVKKNRANTVSVYFGKTKFTLNTMRGFEAFAWPAMILGAVDDWHIRRKQGRTTNTPLQMQDAAIVAGNVLSASLRRGPYAFAAKPLFEAHGDRGVESLARSLAFPAKTMIPVLGSSLAKNISDFLNEPMDRRTLEGALWSNVPFIGPTVAPKSLNAFGEPALATDAADKIFKLGVPIVYDIPNDRNSIMVHELVLKQGGGPSIPNRSQVAKRLDREPTNKEFEMFVREYGAEIKRVMTENIEELSAMDGPDYDRAMEYIGNNARDMAQVKLMEAK